MLRMGSGGKLKHAIFEMFKQRREGDMLMDDDRSNNEFMEGAVYLCIRDG